MPSFSRNIRRAHCARRSRVLGAGLVLALMSAAALADGAHRFVFTAISDAAGGADIVAGRYRAALEELKGRPWKVELDPAAIDTNRCVAYSMTLQWHDARTACDDAVRAAQRRRTLPGALWIWTAARDERDSEAVAYANRAVLHWMLRDEAAARRDLAEARELSPHADFVTRNRAALEMHRVVVAQAGTPAPKS